MTDQTPHHDSASDAPVPDGFARDEDRRDDSNADRSPLDRSPFDRSALEREGVEADAHDTGAVDASDRVGSSATPAPAEARGRAGSSVPASAHANAAPHAASATHDVNHDGTAAHGARRAADGPNYGVGPFSIREVALLGAWFVAFFVSFFRTNILDSPSGVLIGGANVWLSGLWWIPAAALPTVAVGLIVLRRLSPQGIRRVGSLGIDQFASVAFTVAALVWVAWVWDTVAVFSETGIWTRSWVIWVEAIVLLAGVVLTVFAPFIPPFSRDFRDREDVPAHRNARPIGPVIARPRTPRAPRTSAASAAAHDAPAYGATAHDAPVHDGTAHHATPHDATAHGATAHADDVPVPGSYTGSTDLSHDDAAPRTSVLPTRHEDRPDHDRSSDSTVEDDNDTDIFAPLRTSEHDRRESARDQDDRADHGRDDHPHAQAFWALAPEQREIVDDYGTPIFHIGPTAWALVVEDRGETFVVRHDDGRIGYLHDVSGVTRG
ncbi:hypothetical protein [uncultured Microbacterium sp.]|uniref:hypothetical protein n=1 Tax=uncultured Microbacterium sp. TaxID=191216 RepID=UPI0025E93A92|nr:hypothetical protein [uncultured Microbacterium sp.]